jgi:glycine C-acetyltransferase
VISDELNHPSIIDGIRLFKARRGGIAISSGRSRHAVSHARHPRRVSMDGYLAPLADICRLADLYDALVMVDDSHTSGSSALTGAAPRTCSGSPTESTSSPARWARRSAERAEGTSAAGRRWSSGCASDRARGLFSNSVAPAVVAASKAVLDLLSGTAELRQRLFDDADYFRTRMTTLGFTVPPGHHPIVPVMLGDAAAAGQLADRLFGQGRLRRRVLVPGGAAWQPPDPYSDVRSAWLRGPGTGGASVRRGARRTRPGREPYGVIRPRLAPAWPPTCGLSGGRLR